MVPVLTALISYHNYLDKNKQVRDGKGAAGQRGCKLVGCWARVRAAESQAQNL